jgi:hypothetical protein
VLLAGYGGWYAANHGHFGYSNYTGLWLYGRVAPFATCHYSLPRKEAELCPSQPVGKRSVNPEFWADSRSSPIHTLPPGNRREHSALGVQFAIHVIEHQPLAYAGAVLADTWHYFTPGRWQNADHVDMTRWVFPPPHFKTYGHGYHVTFANEGFNRSRIKASPNPALMGPLRTYQSVFYTPGPLLLACLIGALAVALGLARRAAGARHARWAALVLAVSSILVVLSPSMFAQFSYRYGLPLLVLLLPAGAAAAEIGLDALRARRATGRLVPRLRERSDKRARGASAVPVPATASNGDGAPPDRAHDLHSERAG